MKKSMLTPAIIICSMMALTSNANAALWLDVIKEFVVGGVKTIVMPKSITNPLADNKPAPATKPATEAPQSKGEPTAQDIWDALQKLKNVCKDIGTKVPCSVGEGKSFSTGTAENKAFDDALVKIAKTMGTYIDNNVEMDLKSDEDEAGIIKEVQTYVANGKLKTQQLVSGAQQYMSYTYIDEAGTELNNGRTVYITTIVMVMNKDIFKQGLEDISKDKPLSEQLIKESKKGILTIFKNAIKKI